MRYGESRSTGCAGKRALAQRCAALALLPLLSGCVAAAIAVPAMTAYGALAERKSARTAPASSELPAAAAARESEGTSPALASVLPESGAVAEVTSLTALPSPTTADLGGDPWREFATYALEQSAELGRTTALESAVLAPAGVRNLAAQRRPCGGTEPAVIIDLDNGRDAFSPEGANTPSPGLSSALARLRDAGFVVLWISSADANRVDDVAAALRRTGLDPEGRDPLLLALNEDDRKQTMREEANENLCVVAVAGDRRADFDELFDYLRNPDAAAGLDSLIGSGWFITPVPVASGPRGTQ